MSKQEKIKEVYGRIFDSHKQFIDEDGWFNNSDEIEYVTAGDTQYLGECDYKNNTFFRPKSLSGIENNNGWIKIESFDNLPKSDCEVFFIKNKTSELITGCFYFGQFGDPFFCDGPSVYDVDKVTHYQPIIKPKPPIY